MMKRMRGNFFMSLYLFKRILFFKTENKTIIHLENTKLDDISIFVQWCEIYNIKYVTFQDQIKQEQKSVDIHSNVELFCPVAMNKTQKY